VGRDGGRVGGGVGGKVGATRRGRRQAAADAVDMVETSEDVLTRDSPPDSCLHGRECGPFVSAAPTRSVCVFLSRVLHCVCLDILGSESYKLVVKLETRMYYTTTAAEKRYYYVI